MATPAEYAAAAWTYQFGAAEGFGLDRPAKDWLLDTYGKVKDTQVAVAEAQTVLEQILAAIQGAEFPVTGTVHIGSE